MARNRGQGKALPRGREKYAQCSASSQASDASTDDVFENYIDDLFEKRPATRVHGLEGLVSLLCSTVCPEECMAREETLTRLFLQSVLRGKGAEPLLGARGLGLLILTLGLEEGGERIWTSTREGLLKTAGGIKADVACAAVDAYAIGCFVAEDDVFQVLESMSNLRKLWKKANSKIRAKAIGAWTLLLSSLSPDVPLDSSFGEVVGILRSFLDEKDLGIRKVAGEALAMLHTMGMADDDILEDSDSMSIASSSTCISRSSAMEEVVDKMKGLSQGKGDRRKSKKDRATQRAAFRGFCNFVEDGVLQETKIKLRHGDVLVIDDLAQLIQLNFIRTMLAEGFQTHIQANELLHQIFNYSPRSSAPEKLNKREKRMHKSPSSATNKMRSVGRGAARNQKDNLMCGGGGEFGFL
ncbi:hypothetical protein BSKO_11027 [Bryopsis sp. KO-2023]|nr:hypothetical protein BSKO_11027 [Bryopsis sp. KO-2023]